MKNGDTLVLHEFMKIQTHPEASYSYENTPLETMEDLKALIAKIESEVSPEAIVRITLAPVVYEGDLELANRAIFLTGTANDSGDGSRCHLILR